MQKLKAIFFLRPSKLVFTCNGKPVTRGYRAYIDLS